MYKMHGMNKNCLQNFVLQHQGKRLNTLYVGLCWWCGFIKWKHKYYKKAHRHYYTQTRRWMWKSTVKPKYVVNIREFHLTLCFMVGGYHCCGGTTCLCGQCNNQYVPQKWWLLSVGLKTSHPRKSSLSFHRDENFNLLTPELFFEILAHTVYKIWIKQEPNTLELWNKLHFEEKKTESVYHV